MLIVNLVRWTKMPKTINLLCVIFIIDISVSQNVQNLNMASKSNNSETFLMSEEVTGFNSSESAANNTGLKLNGKDKYETLLTLKEDGASRRVLDLSPSDSSANSAMMDDLIKKFGNDYFLKEDDTNSSLDTTTDTGLRKMDVIQKLIKTVTQSPQITEEEESLGERVLESLKDPEIRPQTGVEWLLDVYNPHRWRPNLLPGARRLSSDCKRDMKIYLTALTNGSIWAAKMTDASGRYSSQFFFGNDFWLGSHTLCQELQNLATNKIVPPYPVAFHVAKLLLSLHHDLTPTNRQISLGVCLPKTCNATDISVILQPETSPAIVPHSIQVLKVRPIPGEYSLLKDRKFHILLTVVGILWLCIAVGTGYETIVERRQRRLDKRPAVVNNNEDESSRKLASPLNNITPIKTPKMGDKDQLNSSGSDISAEDSFRVPISMFGQVLLSFSALSNGRKILDAGAAPKDALTCVHGLRFFSLAWVIMVHTYLQVFAIAENKTLRTLTERNFMFQTVSNATFSVDTFFFISGLLVTFLYFKTLRVETADQKLRRRRDLNAQLKSGANRFFTLLGYRFIRLTPAYMFVLVVAQLNMRWIRNNSVFEPVNQDQINCDLYWWRNALYINSLYPMKDMCMLWSWYLADDTQFYVIGILLLLVSVRHFRVAVAAMFVFLVSSWITTATISVQYGYKVRVEYPFALFDELYDKPWTRLGPYLVGMFVGWFLFKTKCKIHVSKFTVISCWVLSLLVLSSLVYGVLNAQLGVHATAIYVSLGHTAWGLALAWIVIACCSGYGGYINSLLSCRLLHPLSRLTYCAYLVHPVIMVLTSFQMDGPLHLHNGLVLVLYFGNVVTAFILSFVISMTFEAPIVRLLKVAISPRPRRTNSPSPE